MDNITKEYDELMPSKATVKTPSLISMGVNWTLYAQL